ncbi:MAG: PLP-dependent transferase [Thermomicrobiales bacterium]|nr:PLP-dependent transferase [Thermomicrobiales bacterium]
MATRAVHAGEQITPPSGVSTAMPIYPATAFVYDRAEDLEAVIAREQGGYVYSRWGNPTTRALEEAVAGLEGTADAVAFGSGMAAVHAALLLDARAGDNILASPDVYGATYTMLTTLLPSLGISASFVDMQDLEAVRSALRERRPSLVFLETISNPLLRVANLPAIIDLAHEAGAAVAVDNTFASPCLVQPALLGADTVLHSSTKYLAGHGDATGGVVAASAERVAKLRDLSNLLGATPGPFEAWLTLRGIRTLPLRMRQHGDNARQVAEWLRFQPGVAAIHYPAADVADGVFISENRGGMVAFELADAGQREVFRFLNALRLFKVATTLGDVHSLVLYPVMSSHRWVPVETRRELGISDGLLRLSIGIEDVSDIVADLERGLRAVAQAEEGEH